MDDILWLRLAYIIGSIALFFVLIVAACMWEKRPIQPYYVPERGKEYAPSSVAKQANQQAQQLGYEQGGLCHDGKGRLYRIRYDFWIAADLSTIAIVGSGTLMKIPVEGVWLWSRLTGGRILCTTNEIGEQDISGIVDQQTWQGLRLDALADKHARRLTEAVVEPFAVAAPMIGYFELRRQKADALVDRGYAYYMDDDQTAWRYTFKGAVVFYVMGSLVRPTRRLLRSIGLVRE